MNKEMTGGAQVHFYGEADKSAAYGKAVGVAVQVCRRAVEHALATHPGDVLVFLPGQREIARTGAALAAAARSHSAQARGTSSASTRSRCASS